MRLIKIVLVTCISVPLVALSGENTNAELAIRWNPSTTSTTLRSVSSIIDTLKIDPKKVEKDNYIVSYYKITPTTPLPSDVEIIARKRVKNGSKVQLMTKYRSAFDLTDFFDVNKWECPLAKHFPDIKPEIKYETDISFGKGGTLVRLHSLSCSIESKSNIAFPSVFHPEDLKDYRKMQRTKIGEIKLDKWTDSRAEETLEVSVEGVDSGASIDNFYKKIAYPLIKQNIDPILASKSGL